MDQIRDHIQRNQFVYVSIGVVALSYVIGYRTGAFIENVRIGLKVNDHVKLADATIVFFARHPEIEKQFMKEVSSASFWPVS